MQDKTRERERENDKIKRKGKAHYGNRNIIKATQMRDDLSDKYGKFKNAFSIGLVLSLKKGEKEKIEWVDTQPQQ